MRKFLLPLLFICLSVQGSMAQVPKWVEKAKRAVFSIVTYDKNDKMLSTGNGFFVTEDGIALSDYSLFKGAERAIIINSEGKQMPVDAILGADDMYDVIKFRVGITEKKVPALQIASMTPVVGAEVYLLPYSTQKDRNCTLGKVKEVAKIGEQYHYYTLDMLLKDKMVSCPVTTADGQVFGLAQKSSGRDTTSICYAAGAAFAMSQNISALSLNDLTLRNIGIKKGLPETEDQAMVALFMASSQVPQDEYMMMLDDYIKQFPNSSEGYIRRASALVFGTNKDESSYDRAAADLEQALKVTQKKDDAYYNIAKLIYNYQIDKPETTYKDWTYDKALEYVRSAQAVDSLPVYVQLEGDILFAKQDYPAALTSYEKVNRTNLASPASFFNEAKTMELLERDPKEIVAVMDSCIAHCQQPVSATDAPYLLERAQMNMNAGLYRPAMLDYDTYYKAVNGQVNDVFFYLREQAAIKGRQYQRALDDIAEAIRLNPKEVLYYAEQAVVNMRVNRFDEAIGILENAISINPDYAEAYRLLGICQVQLKKMKEACDNFAKAKSLGDPSVDSLIEKHCK